MTPYALLGGVFALESLGPSKEGRIAPGVAADLVVLAGDGDVQDTVVAGSTAHSLRKGTL